MRSRPALLALTTALALTGAIGAAGPAAAGGPPSTTLDHDCRIGTQCNTSVHNGWVGELPPRRNVGG
jgi:hypothetical protein